MQKHHSGQTAITHTHTALQAGVIHIKATNGIREDVYGQ